MKLSYIIVTSNRVNLPQYIQDLFTGYLNREGINLEIIVADDNSTADILNPIRDICKDKYGIPVKYLRFNRKLFPNAIYSDAPVKNSVVYYANSEFVVVSDSDVYPCNPDFLMNIIELPERSYVSPNLLRFKTEAGTVINKDFYKFIEENWMNSECWVNRYYSDPRNCKLFIPQSFGFVGGMFACRSSDYINCGGIPLIQEPFWEYERHTTEIWKKLGLTLNEGLCKKLFAVHFEIPYINKWEDLYNYSQSFDSDIYEWIGKDKCFINGNCSDFEVKLLTEEYTSSDLINPFFGRLGIVKSDKIQIENFMF